jgi:LysR family transcriptional regulator of abg operon
MHDDDPWSTLRPHQLRDFIAVADTGSLRAAARKLGLTQPSLTKSLRQLETQLEVAIISRTSHGVTLTSAGRLLLEHARLIESEIRRTNDEFRRMRGGSAARINVGLSVSLAFGLLGQAVKLLRARDPEIPVRIVESTHERLIADVRQGLCDFALMPVSTRGHLADLRIRPLFEARVIVVGRTGHPCSGATSLTDLKTCDWITPRRHGTLKELIDRQAGSLGLNALRWMVECDSAATYWDMIADSDLVGLALQTDFESRNARAFGVVALLDTPELPTVTVALLHRPDAVPSGGAAALADLCRDLAGRHVVRRPLNE